MKCHNSSEPMSLRQISTLRVLRCVITQVDVMPCVCNDNVEVVLGSPLVRGSKAKVSRSHFIF